MLLDPGERVAMEEPGYRGARAALGAGGAEVVPVPVDEEGLTWPRSGGAGARVRAAYVTPSHQYPLGDVHERRAAARAAGLGPRRGAWILEDDYDSEYRYVSRPLGPLQGMDAHERVIYIGTFSKVLFPALRVGYLVVPPPLRQRFVEAREALDLFSPTLYQLALADFLREGHFARHLRRMRGVYRARRGRAAHRPRPGMRAAGSRSTTPTPGSTWRCCWPDGLDDEDVVQAHGAIAVSPRHALSSLLCRRRRVRAGCCSGFGGSDRAALLEADPRARARCWRRRRTGVGRS